MRFTKLFTAFIAILLCFSLSGLASAEKLTQIRTAWMDEHETFLIWYAKEKGWDKEAGLDIEILYFDSGMAILNSLPAGEWVFAGMGAVPAMMGNLRYDTYIIGNGNDESLTNSVLVRPDSPVMKTKGYNKDYPDVYGSPDTVRGKTFLCTTVSSAHFALSSWLKTLGLKDSDVTIKNMDQAQALAAFDNGIGDGVALWAPHMYTGEAKGWKIAANSRTCKEGQPIVLIAEKKYADANPEVVAKFLSVYLRSVNMLKNDPLESLVPEYQRFFLEWAGKNYSKELALQDLKTHPVYDLQEQLAMFDASKGESQAQHWQSQIAKFFAGVGRINQEELKKVESGSYATDKFLKLVKTPIPSYK